MEMKVSFINASPNEDLGERERRKAIASFPPLGILYLAAVLKERGVEVSVLDQPAKGFSIEETVKWIEKEEPDILGFSTFASSGRTAALISNEVKRKNPNIVIMFGNHYATFNSERILRKYPSVDIIVRGEGENTVIDLVRCLRERKDKLKNVQGITFRNKNSIISTLDRPLIGDLDCLPFPDRKLIDTEYHCTIVGANAATKKFTSIVSSRGCAYRCRFCSCRQFSRGKWRPRSVQDTIEELHFLASEGYKQFIFVDDCFTLNRNRVIKLCRRMRKERLDMEWICEGRVDNCSYEMLKETARANCKILYFGIESANQRILNYYNKQTTRQQSKTAVKKARKAGIDVIIGSFIVGAPDETREEIQNTIKFTEQIPIDFPQFNILGAYPGTDIWNELEMKELLRNGEHWETGIAISEICPNAVPLREIRKMVHEAFYHFIRRPSFVLTQIARTLRSPYRMNVVLNNLNQIGRIRENVRNVT
jgi:anaerobic magnesium-protoporphyrin IX monomethyl ester cyclase